ncbi:UDP-N-acetylglucosamine 1-carboxyvinyltransferase [Paenibacillus nasutitermitis]|uniref:UDP-N-acetylglucosamine 1-carboxyvinyltransferase n=1 Tax=Paenibacillus nasutitermitis TaxID=1652958 RepID=A0A916Z4C1_9BACL|nr:UDP-N-acetylglucosamine 1-carboxyvinyltransferase [Paenibacillus nasutitermitis]GGD76173.1 UDP-N-acetylglucosamine 1-carboxyvinyltransferase [Paenibacillus nasutitermitis]
MVLALKNKTNLIYEPYLQIEGGIPLHGEVSLPGAKNSALPAIVAACLSEEEVVLHNVPLELNDVKQLTKLLNQAGATVKVEGDKLICSGRQWSGGTLDGELAGKIRHSLLLLGLSANWRANMFLPLPGGCNIGSRKHDLHVFALQELGFAMEESEMGLHLKESQPKKEVEFEFHYPTFGGTLNVLFAAVRSGSVVTLKNAAKNPEIIDVIQLLQSMGADIEWVEPKTLRVRGVEKLKGTDYTVMSDRIIAATIIAAVGVTKGQATIRNATTKVLEEEVKTWREAGLSIEEVDNGIHVEWRKPLKAVDVTTRAYPGFHTDIQPLHTTLMCKAQGTSTLTETILDGRFAYCEELNKLGATIEVSDGGFQCVNGAQGQIARIVGTGELRGTDVMATDIRGGAAVAVAALGATGTSRITNLYQLERGYGNFTEIFQALGASIVKIN